MNQIPPKPEPDLKSSPGPARESHTRSILKGVSWRVVGTLTTVLTAWLVTGDASAAISIGFIEVFAKIGIFYAHERVWARIPIA